MIIPSGTVSRAPSTNIRPNRRTAASFSASGPTMNPGVSHSEITGSRNDSHRAEEVAGLVGRLGVDRAAEMVTAVGNQPVRHALDANERGDDPDPVVGPQFQHRADVDDRLDGPVHVVGA